jgi:hypothetical protein
MQHEHKRNSDTILRRLKKTLSNEIFEGVFYCQNILILRQGHPPGDRVR